MDHNFVHTAPVLFSLPFAFKSCESPRPRESATAMGFSPDYLLRFRHAVTQPQHMIIGARSRSLDFPPGERTTMAW